MYKSTSIFHICLSTVYKVFTGTFHNFNKIIFFKNLFHSKTCTSMSECFIDYTADFQSCYKLCK